MNAPRQETNRSWNSVGPLHKKLKSWWEKEIYMDPECARQSMCLGDAADKVFDEVYLDGGSWELCLSKDVEGDGTRSFQGSKIGFCSVDSLDCLLWRPLCPFCEDDGEVLDSNLDGLAIIEWRRPELLGESPLLGDAGDPDPNMKRMAFSVTDVICFLACRNCTSDTCNKLSNPLQRAQSQKSNKYSHLYTANTTTANDSTIQQMEISTLRIHTRSMVFSAAKIAASPAFANLFTHAVHKLYINHQDWCLYTYFILEWDVTISLQKDNYK